MSAEKFFKSILGIPESPPSPVSLGVEGRGAKTHSWSEVKIKQMNGREIQIIKGGASAPGCSVEGEGVKTLGKRYLPVQLTGTVYSRTHPDTVASVTVVRR